MYIHTYIAVEQRIDESILGVVSRAFLYMLQPNYLILWNRNFQPSKSRCARVLNETAYNILYISNSTWFTISL